LYFTTGQNPAVAPIDQNGVPGAKQSIANPDPGRGMGAVAATPDGKFLYIGEYGGNTSTGAGLYYVAEFSINHGSGALTHMETIPIPNAGAEKVDPTGSVIAFGGNVMTSPENGNPNVTIYKIASNGSLVPAGAPVPLFGFTVRDMAFDASGEFLYVLTQQSNPATPGSSLQALGVDNTSGSLILGQSIPLTIDANAIAVVGSKYVYISLSNEIAGYSIQSDGSPTPIPGTPFGVGVGAYGLAATSAGSRLYASDILKHDIAWFTVGATGTLTRAGTTAPNSFTPDAGSTLLVDHSDRFLYGVACAPGVGPGCHYEFWGGTIGSNGAVTSMPGAPFPIQPFGYDLVY
jgi:hypothetical protein